MPLRLAPTVTMTYIQTLHHSLLEICIIPGAKNLEFSLPVGLFCFLSQVLTTGSLSGPLSGVCL